MGAPLCAVLLLHDGLQGDNTSWGLSYASPNVPSVHSGILLRLVRQPMPFSNWQHGEDAIEYCGPHSDEYRQAWVSITTLRL